MILSIHLETDQFYISNTNPGWNKYLLLSRKMEYLVYHQVLVWVRYISRTIWSPIRWKQTNSQVIWFINSKVETKFKLEYSWRDHSVAKYTICTEYGQFNSSLGCSVHIYICAFQRNWFIPTRTNEDQWHDFCFLSSSPIQYGPLWTTVDLYEAFDFISLVLFSQPCPIRSTEDLCEPQ